jgi:amidase/aspartyl-tRNA(Asn)/glutamyl-tRNA(Gln) amidotransferase subunit A
VAVIRELLDAREVSTEEVVRASLERIAELNDAVNGVVALRARPALAEALARDALPPEERGPLHGVPFSVKDVTETLDLPTTYGSAAFAGHRSEFEALVVTRLRGAGAILVGKTNTPPFACEPVTRGELFGETINPWAPERTSGGSSGGAAAGLATGMFTLAQGTDAGGSNRIPASCCGVVGVKPTRGRVSFAPGVYEPWGGLLHSGPLARSVRDAAVMLDVMAGSALGEPGVGALPLACWQACELPLGPTRGAYSSALPGGSVDDDVAVAFADALEVFRSLGVELVADRPDVSGLAEPFTTIAEVAFAGLAHEMTDERVERIGQGPRQLIDHGREIAAGAYYAAQQTAHRESASILRFWEEYDVLITPTVPWVPPLSDRLPATESYEEKWAQYGMWEAFTSPANVTGQPAISLPCRILSSTGVPIGIQLIGRYGGEAELFTLAAAYERAAPWDDRRPDCGRFRLPREGLPR